MNPRTPLDRRDVPWLLFGVFIIVILFFAVFY
jgi:hypothetical protein